MDKKETDSNSHTMIKDHVLKFDNVQRVWQKTTSIEKQVIEIFLQTIWNC